MFEKRDDNADLISKMVKRAHVDVARSIGMWDFMGANAWRGALARCSRCPAADQCRKFLAEDDGRDGRQAIPDFCVNKVYLSSLPETA